MFLKLYRASWYPTVEAKDAKEWLDISDIQTFSINNHEVVYLNLRPRIEKEKESNGRTNLCETCQRIKGNGLASQQIRGEKRIAAAVDPSTDLPPRRRRRLRKGIPQRAPFF
ncbi:unnamed protein product [Ilex paraguariensis]|uniref:Uncharacterized protein n=1 Tax=Ilex paraguariensis TaxID=185542 RepID=A0ABC8UWR6_9AQUA